MFTLPPGTKEICFEAVACVAEYRFVAVVVVFFLGCETAFSAGLVTTFLYFQS